MLRGALLGGAFITTLTVASGATLAVAADTTPPSGRISQFLEMRDGTSECLGIVIELHSTTFKPSITEEQLNVTDDKYGRDLKDIIAWRVDRRGKRLTIRFKPGMGGFGTGNVVHITVRTSAFVRPPATEGLVAWSISTDPL